MNLYKITRKYGPGQTADWDEALGFVVAAGTATNARRMAAKQAGDEGPDIWTSARYSTVTILSDTSRCAAGVVLRDFNAG